MTTNSENQTTNKKCFIVSPIGSDGSDIRRHIDGIIDAAIAPVLKKFNYTLSVSHRMARPGTITKQILGEIYNSELVIANLTSLNPNVMYELAFRHSLGKHVVILAEKGTTLPFDVGNERTIFYRNDSKGVLELQEELDKTISALDFEENKLGPIYDALREVSDFNTVVSSIESQNSKDVDVLKFIVNKLETIEGNIYNRNYNLGEQKIRETTFFYETDDKKLRNKISKDLSYILSAYPIKYFEEKENADGSSYFSIRLTENEYAIHENDLHDDIEKVFVQYGVKYDELPF